jgi:hypothetical protein
VLQRAERNRQRRELFRAEVPDFWKRRWVPHAAPAIHRMTDLLQAGRDQEVATCRQSNAGASVLTCAALMSITTIQACLGVGTGARRSTISASLPIASRFSLSVHGAPKQLPNLLGW